MYVEQSGKEDTQEEIGTSFFLFSLSFKLPQSNIRPYSLL